MVWRVEQAMIAFFKQISLRLVDSIRFCSGYFVDLFLTGPGYVKRDVNFPCVLYLDPPNDPLHSYILRFPINLELNNLEAKDRSNWRIWFNT